MKREGRGRREWIKVTPEEEIAAILCHKYNPHCLCPQFKQPSCTLKQYHFTDCINQEIICQFRAFNEILLCKFELRIPSQYQEDRNKQEHLLWMNYVFFHQVI